jgi:hypothetical protein
VTRDVRDALMIAGFFLGYAVMLSLSRRVPRVDRLQAIIEQRSWPAIDVQPRRMTFWHGMRDALIAQENDAQPVSHDGD